MIPDARVVSMIEQINQIMDALLDHDLIVLITAGYPNAYRGEGEY